MIHGDTKENVSGCFFLNTVYNVAVSESVFCICLQVYFGLFNRVSNKLSVCIIVVNNKPVKLVSTL